MQRHPWRLAAVVSLARLARRLTVFVRQSQHVATSRDLGRFRVEEDINS
jgi:hypothetical protein